MGSLPGGKRDPVSISSGGYGIHSMDLHVSGIQNNNHLMEGRGRRVVGVNYMYYYNYSILQFLFLAKIHETVSRGGRCLLPVFALGRAQELLLILDEYWAAHPELHDIPIYYASALAKKCMAGKDKLLIVINSY